MVYLFSHQQRALVSIWFLSLALNSHGKEREKESNERERHLKGSMDRFKNKFGPMIPGFHVVGRRQEMEVSKRKEPKEMYFDM